MATLTGNTIAGTYTGLLSVTGAIGATTLESVTDGAGTATSLSLSQQKAKIVLGTDSGDDFTINNGSADIVLVEGDTNDVSLLDDLKLVSDSAQLSFGADSEVSLTHVHNEGLLLNSTNKIQFYDSSQYIQGSSATALTLAATAEIDLTATTIDINGTADVSGTLTVGGTVTVNAAAVFNEGSGDYDFRVEGNGNANLLFCDAGNDRVGIGTDSPDGLLHIESSTSNKPFFIIRNSSTSSQEGGNFLFENADTNGFLSDDTILGDIIWRMWDDTDDDWLNCAKIGARINGTAANNDAPGEIFFETTTDGAATPSQKMCILNNGNVGIGTVSPDTLLDVEDDVANGSVVTFKNTHNSIDDNDNILALQFSGDASGAEGNFIIFSDSDTAEMGVIKAADASVSVDAYSDYRLKENIETLTGGLAKVNALNPVTFQYKSDSGNATHEGFIAHEVQEHIPYAVRGVKDAVRDDGSIKAQSFCIYQLIPQMVSAIKELSASNDALKARIEVLEAA